MGVLPVLRGFHQCCGGSACLVGVLEGSASFFGVPFCGFVRFCQFCEGSASFVGVLPVFLGSASFVGVLPVVLGFRQFCAASFVGVPPVL